MIDFRLMNNIEYPVNFYVGYRFAAMVKGMVAMDAGGRQRNVNKYDLIVLPPFIDFSPSPNAECGDGQTFGFIPHSYVK